MAPISSTSTYCQVGAVNTSLTGAIRLAICKLRAFAFGLALNRAGFPGGVLA